MKILITGGKGQIAWDLQQVTTTKKHQLIPLDLEELDITKSQQIEKLLIHYQPDLVINCAAYTAVDKAEQEKQLAFLINAEGAGLLAQHCAKKNIPLIHLSTDYVFSGEQTQAYDETDPTNPLNIYGASKLEGEKLIQKYHPESLILRLSGVFGTHGHNFVKTILRLVQEKEELYIVDDQITCQTPSEDIANAIYQIIEKLDSLQKPWGIYHYCSSFPASWYTFTQAIVNHVQELLPLKAKRINPVSSDTLNSPAKRPKYSVLSCKKIKETFNIDQRHWQPGLKKVINHWAKTLNSDFRRNEK